MTTPQTPTPSGNETWECFCDECYFHLWRVRRKTERSFNDGFHVHNGKEANALVELLNNKELKLLAVQRELEEARKDKERYEYVRKLHSVYFRKIIVENIKTGKPFDDIVDDAINQAKGKQ